MPQDQGNEHAPVMHNAATESMQNAISNFANENITTIAGKQALLQPAIDIDDLLREKKLTAGEVRDGLGEFIWKHRQVLPEEMATSWALTLNSSLFVDHQPIENNQIRYYGRTFLINGLDATKVTASEVVIGLLAVRNEEEKIVGYLDLSAQKFSEDCEAEVVSLADERTIQTSYLPSLTEPLDKESLDRFLQEERLIFRRPLGHLNLAALPLLGRLYAWKMVSTNRFGYIVEDENPLQLFLQKTGPDGLKFFESVDGDPALIDNIVQTTAQIDWNTFFNNSALGNECMQLLTEIVFNQGENATLTREITSAITPDENLDDTHVRVNYDYLTDIQKRLAKEVAQTATAAVRGNQLTLWTGLAGHHLGIQAFNNVVNSLFALHHGEAPPQLAPFDQHEITLIEKYAAAFPHAEATRSVLIYQWLIRAISNQQGINPKERKAWLRSFYDHVINLGVYHEKSTAYADSGREVPRYTNALETLVDKGFLPPKFNYLTLGCGDGLRVDKPAFEALRTKRPEIVPEKGHIWGVDMFDSPEKWEDMEFILHTIEYLLENQPDLVGTMDLVSVIGSPLSNMNLIGEHFKYLQTITGLLKEGGIAMFEIGSEQPVAELNDRLKRMKLFNQRFPNQPLGTLPVNDTYRRSNDKPDEVGAFIPPESIYVAMAKLFGLELISPPPDPVSHDDLVASLQDPKALQNQTIQGDQNALTNPYYMEDAENWKEDKPVRARAALFFKKTGPPLVDLQVLFAPTFTPLQESNVAKMPVSV